MDRTSMNALFREYTNERNTTRLSDTRIDFYMQSGLEAFNRRVGYKVKDDNTTVVFATGTGEYTLPADLDEIVFVELPNGTILQKSDVDEWRRRGIDWRDAQASTPTEWAVQGRKIIFSPKPDVNLNTLKPVLRYVAAPLEYTTNGPDSIGTQDHRIVVFYAVAEFSEAYPDSAFALQRAERFYKKFEVESAAVREIYARRRLLR